MPSVINSQDWAGLQVTGPVDLLEFAEAVLCATLGEKDFLGSERQTWCDPNYKPVQGANSDSQSPECETLRIYLSPQADLGHCSAEAAETLRKSFPDAMAEGVLNLGPFSTPHEDWAVLWKDFFHPIGISDNLLILPAWWERRDGLKRTGLEGSDPLVLRIEPGRAFGSGTHATTRLCLRMMERILWPGVEVLDFGAGSGILSFAAAAMGAGAVVGVEVDPDAHDNFLENFALNRAAAGGVPLDYRQGSSDALRDWERFDLIVCNALFPRVSGDLPDLTRYHLSERGRFLYSGFLREEKDEIIDFFTTDLALEIKTIEFEEEWSALIACQPSE